MVSGARRRHCSMGVVICAKMGHRPNRPTQATLHVFSYKGKRIQRMYNRAWRQARTRAGLPRVRVHDLKHTFGRRLRSAGVSFEDRQDLLGHKSGRITTHYSMPEHENLIAAANKVCPKERHKIDTMVILKKKPRLAVVG